jgi:IS4 transposase
MDLGYFKFERFHEIQRYGAFFISRFKFNTTAYILKDGVYQPINLIEIKNQMKQGEQKVMSVYIGPLKLPTRLILEKVPEPVANEKRRKLKTDKQNKRKNLSKERLELCDLNAYITNTSEEQISLKQVREYYGLRWQIEIIFKAWKSVYKIDMVKKMKLERFECIHYATLILILLTTQLINYGRVLLYNTQKEELSELKMFKTLKLLLTELKMAIKKTEQNIIEFLDLLETSLLITCVKQQKRGKKTPYNIVNICLT